MGLFRTSDTIITQAMPLTAAMIASIDARPAWLFQNQSGTLGTNLDSSVVYCGVMPADASISVILSGVVSQSVATFTLTSGGSGYQESGSANIVTTVLPPPGSGLTIDITVPVPTTKASTPGGGYSVAAFTVTGGTGTGLSGTIDSVTGGGATGPIGGFTIIDGGQGYSEDDVLVIVSGDGIGGSMTLATAPNGAVTVGAIRAAGERYSIGDVITINQAGSGLNATFRVDMVRGLAPVLSDGVLFTGLQAGDILPIYVDYVLATTTTAGALVAGRESSIG